MFTRTLRLRPFLHAAYGEQFAAYCTSRGIPFEQGAPTAPRGEDVQRWTEVFTQLPAQRQATVELELAKVNEMAGREEIEHLLRAAGETAQPPDHIPGGVPLALWFLLHHPSLFHEVFLRHEFREVDGWRSARAACDIRIDDLDGKATALTTGVRSFFRLGEGSGRFCAVDAHRLDGYYCFAAQVADRLQLVEGFSEEGKPTIQRLRASLPVLFTYDPRSGAVHLKCRLRSPVRLRSLFNCFAESVLGQPIESIDDVYDLDRFKQPFHPAPDGPDMEDVRVKALGLRYPEQAQYRKLMLETLVRDRADAMDALLAEHLRDEALAEQLTVCYAELQVRLRTEGGVRNYLIFLWPDRCSLDRSPLGLRLHACLRRWGIAHAV